MDYSYFLFYFFLFLQLHNADGVLVLNDDSLTLTCPQTDEEVVTWEYKHLRGFGYIRQVCWVEAGRNCSSGHGVFCFSTKQAESLFETLNRLLARQHSGTNFRRRLSRRNNLSWTSLGESVLEETVKQAAALPKATEAQVGVCARESS